MNRDSAQMDAFFDRVKADTKKARREDLRETLAGAAIGADFGYWAYGTVAHAALFGFIIFATSAVGNRVVAELRMERAQEEAKRLLDEL